MKDIDSMGFRSDVTAKCIADDVLHVISHTHWDREWYLPFEQFRLRLVRLMDRVLDILGDQEDYRFHLDAQTIILEDYLEIRRNREAELARYIRERRLFVGPWYVQSDFFLTSGEATIRNLMIGSDIARHFGYCSRIGYAADQFGIISQLPQILRGFGMDTFLFGRGYQRPADEDGRMPSVEFLWEGADGTAIEAHHMAFWYNNAQRFSADVSRSTALVRKILDEFTGRTGSSHLLCMNGVDHLEAQDDLLPILEELNRRHPKGPVLRQGSLEEFFADLRRSRSERGGARESLEYWKGELRQGPDDHILQGTLSSRIYLKVLNARAQAMLESVIEPLWALLALILGDPSVYPSAVLEYMWKLLLRNHAHDSICGCSADAVHSHMEDRYARLAENADVLLRDGMELLAGRLPGGRLPAGGGHLLVVNTLEFDRNPVVEADIHIPSGLEAASVRIEAPDGSPVPFTVLGNERMLRNVLSPLNLPGNVEVDSFRCLIEPGEVPGFGYRALRVIPLKEKQPEPRESASPEIGSCVLENPALRVDIDEYGRIDLTDRITGRTFSDVMGMEESADCGDVYTYRPEEHPSERTLKGLRPKMEIHRNGDVQSVCRLHYDWMLPARFDRSIDERSAELRRNRLSITLTLNRCESMVRVCVDLENASEDHRIRMVVRTGIADDRTWALSPFDVVRRNLADSIDQGRNGVEPGCDGVALADDEGGVSILSEGVYAYENGGMGNLFFTIVRGNRYIFKDFDGVDMRNDLWQAKGNQCLRPISLNLALAPFGGPFRPMDLVNGSRSFLAPPAVHYHPADPGMRRGGRPAVQDPAVAEIFYEPDPFESCILPEEACLLECTGDAALSTLHYSEKNRSIVVRAFNPGKDGTLFGLKPPGGVSRIQALTLDEVPINDVPMDDGDFPDIEIAPGKILTLGLKMDGSDE